MTELKEMASLSHASMNPCKTIAPKSSGPLNNASFLKLNTRKERFSVTKATAEGNELKASTTLSSGVTIEYQRQRAKEMVAYFQEKSLEQQYSQGQVFGFTRKNEIGNGRSD